MCFSSAHFFFCILQHATICGFIVRRYFHAAHTHLKLENILLHLALADAGVWWWWCRRRAHNVMLITRLYYLSTHIVCSFSDYKLHTVYIFACSQCLYAKPPPPHTHTRLLVFGTWECEQLCAGMCSSIIRTSAFARSSELPLKK